MSEFDSTQAFQKATTEQAAFLYDAGCDDPTSDAERSAFAAGAAWAARGYVPDDLALIDTPEALDALAAGTVFRSIASDDAWLVVDATGDGLRIISTTQNSYFPSRLQLEAHGPFQIIWSPSTN